VRRSSSSGLSASRGRRNEAVLFRRPHVGVAGHRDGHRNRIVAMNKYLLFAITFALTFIVAYPFFLRMFQIAFGTYN
jgi:nitrate reductase NapE component